MIKCKSLWSLFVCIFATLIALSFVEAILRFIGLGYPIVYEKSVLWGYSPAPNQAEHRLRNSKVTIDHNGFRIAEPLELANQILFLGDSITYGGSYVDDKEIFSSLSCEILNAQNPPAKFSCANAAVNAYGVRNMLARSLYVEKQFPTASIVITVIWDDFYRNFSQLTSLPYFSEKPPEPLPATVELLTYSIDSVRSWVRFRNSAGSRVEEVSPSRIEVDMVVQLLDEFMKRRARNGKHTVMIWSPSRNWFNGIQSEEEKYPYEQLRAQGIKFIDMTYTLKESKALDSDIYYDDAHLERQGHRIYAQTIADKMMKEIGIH